MSSLGSRIRTLRKKSGLKQKDIADKLGMGSSNFGHIENDRVTPSSTDLDIIASLLNTSADFLLGRTTVQDRTCPDCGMSYVLPYDQKEHEQYHSKYLKALDKYGFFFAHEKRERIKKESYDKLKDSSLPASILIEAAETVFKAYFSRSLEGLSFDLAHPSFNDYVAMLLYQNDWKSYLPFNVYNSLVMKYGVKPGIPEGQTSYQINNDKNDTNIVTLAAHKVDGYDDNLTEEEQAAVKAFIEAYRKQFNK